MEKGRSGFSGGKAIEAGMMECNERRMRDVIQSRAGRRAVEAKGLNYRTPRALFSGRVSEAIFGSDAIKSIPR